MNTRLRLFLVATALLTAAPLAGRGEEPYIQFLQGLRDRQYYDTALLYLDQLAQRPNLPADVKPVLLYERAVTLRELAKSLRSPEKQLEQLDQSLNFLDQFVREYPDHPSNGDANFDRAYILMQRADVEIFQAKSPTNSGAKSEYQVKARQFITRAREVLKLAYDQHKVAYDKFSKFIDEQKEAKQKAERTRIETLMLMESVNLAKCSYLEAETYDPESPEFKPLLTKAADEFEKIYQAHRTQLGGILARAWQGKCFEEEGSLQKALGIYNELLDNPGDNQDLVSLKTQVLQFKLICLNTRKDYQLIVDLADEWLKKTGTGDEARTAAGLGILWEQARAYEALGDDRNLPKPEQERNWRLARTAAQQVNRFPGEYKFASTSMLQKLQVKIAGKESVPNNFDMAFSQGNVAFERTQQIRKELEAAEKPPQRPQEEITRLKQDLSNSLEEAARDYELAMKLANRLDNAHDVAMSRLRQGYTYFYLRRNYEAAVLAEYVARTTPAQEGSLALDSAHMALAAFVQAYNENKAPPEKKQEDMDLVIKSANFIATRWPESERANEARIILGNLYKQRKQPAEAAVWYSKVPSSDPSYSKAQMEAGQAYWLAYVAAARLPAETRPSPEQLQEWKSSAESYLRNGIGKLVATLPAEGPIPPELVNSKIFLAEILINQGKDAEAVKLLRDDPQSLVKAVAVPDEAQRPAFGVQSRSSAKSVYTLLLRGYIGMGPDQLNDAQAAMKTLETIAAGDKSSDLTDLYVGLGKILKSELERFRANGETERFDKLSTAFESFLDLMFKREDGQTLGSLSWIAETYLALGEISTDPAKIASYYERAATALNKILTRAQNEPNFIAPDQLLNVKVRLLHCDRMKKNFDTSEQLLTDVLKQRGNDLRAQIEGASLYQDWGANGDAKKLLIAMGGRKDIGLWGWAGVAKRLQSQKGFSSKPEFVETFLDARYNVSLCRFRYAKEQNPKEKQSQLDLCAMELIGSAAILSSIPDDKRAKLNSLYRDVLQEAGKPVTDLPRMEETPVQTASKAEASPGETNSQDAKNSSAKSSAAPAATKPEPTSWTTILVLVVFVAAGIGLVVWIVLNGNKRKAPKRIIGQKPESISFAGIAADKATPEFSFPSATPKPRPKATTSSTRTAAEDKPGTAKPSTTKAARPAPRPEPGSAPAPKPRPKPPAPPSDS